MTSIKGIPFSFTGLIWKHHGNGGWHLISLPKSISTEIRSSVKDEEEGWGRLKVIAKTGKTEWKTAIWFDSKKNTYLLPLKAGIRKKENLVEGSSIKVMLWI
jgi:hypothetical protein